MDHIAHRYNCVNHFENQKTFNDGYHVIHHIKPGLHWTMLPQEFENTLAKHREEGALTFTGHFFEIGLWTFTHNWDQLVKHSVHLLRPGEQPPPREAVIAKLKYATLHRTPLHSTSKRDKQLVRTVSPLLSSR